VELDILRGNGNQPVYFPHPGDNRSFLGIYSHDQGSRDSEHDLKRIYIPKRDIRRWFMTLKYTLSRRQKQPQGAVETRRLPWAPSGRGFLVDRVPNHPGFRGFQKD
jgi:hypothetical protein